MTHHPDPHSELRAAAAAGAMILGNEGRYGRSDTFHVCPEPQFTCEPHEYLAAFPASFVMPLIAERDRLHALVNNPLTENFLEAVRAEVAHQAHRTCNAVPRLGARRIFEALRAAA
ncbi:hypothetical protein [Lysobacter fragariae]